ncbi:DUF397 domain-containing protein [Streptomyces sp. NPDC101213]|uniref:DUF397 domain-containing protein n=1 Tax=Streptomyces sp. NPDC101213 TaxID=3366130 RepID=UPI00380DF2BF
MSTALPGGDDRPTWFTSSYSNGAGGECVECALSGGGALVRDSKGAGEAVVTVGSTAWRSFVRAVREGTQG